MIRYIRDTKELGIVLKPNDGILQIHCSVDASFAVHADAKSHTGVVLSLGAGPCYVSSKKKLHIVTKSSTEAEMVGGTDDVPGLLEQIVELLEGMDEEFAISNIKQDNQRSKYDAINYQWRFKFPTNEAHQYSLFLLETIIGPEESYYELYAKRGDDC